MQIKYLELSKFHQLINQKKLLRCLLYYYYIYDKKYFKNVIYHRYNGNNLIMRLIINYPITFNNILGLKKLNTCIQNSNDYYTCIFLLMILKVKFIAIYINSNQINETYNTFKSIHDIFFMFVLEDADNIIVLYNTKIYNILNEGELIYIDNATCIINDFCFMLHSLSIKFDIFDIITIFNFLSGILNIDNIYNSYEKIEIYLYNKYVKL